MLLSKDWLHGCGSNSADRTGTPLHCARPAMIVVHRITAMEQNHTFTSFHMLIKPHCTSHMHKTILHIIICCLHSRMPPEGCRQTMPDQTLSHALQDDTTAVAITYRHVVALKFPELGSASLSRQSLSALPGSLWAEPWSAVGKPHDNCDAESRPNLLDKGL